MIFNSLRINNYRAYYGESIFDFPTEGERNISILYADNDVGKSCFFSAVLFCLYGPKDNDDLKDLINVNAQSEKSYHAEVSLFVENGQDKIEISRSIDLRGKLDATPSSKDFKCTLELIKNGVPLSTDEDEKADFINSLVHEDASQYFFFDGEKINDYSTASGSKYKLLNFSLGPEVDTISFITSIALFNRRSDCFTYLISPKTSIRWVPLKNFFPSY